MVASAILKYHLLPNPQTWNYAPYRLYTGNMKRSKLWADDSELDLQLFKVAAVQTLPNGKIAWWKVARFVADGQFSQASCRFVDDLYWFL